jgi:hypothetical protein
MNDVGLGSEKFKNREATGHEGVNMEMIKYGGILLKFLFLHLNVLKTK